MPAFNTASGIPYSTVNLINPKPPLPNSPVYSITAEVGSLQLEFRDLSRSAGDPKYEVNRFLGK